MSEAELEQIRTFETRFPYSYFTTTPSSPPSRPDASSTQRTYFFLDVLPPSNVPTKAVLLLLHGFPDSSYGWRKVIAPLSFSGFRCIVPDLLGYGKTSAPDKATRLAEYGAHAMALDLRELMENVVGRETKFVVVGHDWGSWLAWKLANWIPEKLLGVHGICVPYAAPSSKYISIQDLLQTLPHFGYQAFFEENRSTEIIHENLDRFLAVLFISPSMLLEQVTDLASIAESLDVGRKGKMEAYLRDAPPSLDAFIRKASLLSPEDKPVFERLFNPRQLGSIDGGLNWYRTRKVNFEEDRALSSKSLPPLPYKMLCPELDPTSPVQMTLASQKHLPPESKIAIQNLPRCGHWAMLEAAEIVTQSIVTWIEDEVLPTCARQGQVSNL